MATRFVRIDLSDTARDFRPVAIEPGVPLLDRANGNGKLLLRWLGALVAEPEWEGDSLHFFVCDDYGGRLEEVACYPASEDDLRGCLRKDLELLKERLDAAKAESSTQRAVLRAVHQSLTPLLEDASRLDRDNYFFCYQDVDRRWRLVWCPGYQRSDQAPGRVVICSNRACRLLYVRRQGVSGKCPGCQAAPVERPKPQAPPVRVPRSLVVLLLLLLALGMGYWLWRNRAVPVAANPTEPPETVATAGPGPDVDPSKPIEVKISSKQGNSVTFPVGAEFTDFRIEALYSSGYKRFVTKKATLRVADGENAPIEIADGALVGLKPGKVAIHAEFEGVGTETPLHAEVTARLEADQLQLHPASDVKVTPGESIPVEAEAFWKGNSRGVINALPGLSWMSSDEKVARAGGGTVTGVDVGEATLVARYGDLASDPTKVAVVASDSQPLVVNPRALRLRVGQSARLGVDLTLVRGEGAGAIDVSNECKVSCASQNTLRYLPEAQAILGAAPGVSVVAFSHGEQMATTSVEVVEADVLGGEVLIEPATGVLSPGQAESLRVFVLTKEGSRIDQTAKAAWNSSAPAVATVENGQIRAIAPGTARLTAAIPGVEATGHATMIVQDRSIEALVVEPSALRLQVGDRADLSFQVRSAAGLHGLSNPADVKITVGGPNPGAVRIERQRVVGVTAGDAVLSLELAGKQAIQVPVRVENDPWTDLALDPQIASIPQGEAVLYILSGVRGGQRRALWPQDGVRLSVADTTVGEVIAAGMTVRGRGLGQTTVAAEFAGKRVEAPFRVVAAGQAPAVTGNRAADLVVTDPATGRLPRGSWVFDPDRERIVGPGVRADRGGFIEGVTDGVWAGDGPAPIVARSEAFGNISTETENERDKDFGVRATIDAPLRQMPLEYRVYPPGAAPPETWVLAQPQGDRQRAVLHCGRLTRGDADASYRLIFEARPRSGGPAQQYPYTFQLKSTIVPHTTSEP